MQEQMLQAITGAVAQVAATPSGPAGGSSEAPGRRILAAMVTASRGECQCHPCKLLREELSGLLGGFLEAATAPAAETPPPVDPQDAAPPPALASEAL